MLALLLPLIFWSLSFGSISSMWQRYRVDRAKAHGELIRWKDRETRDALLVKQSFEELKKRSRPPRKKAAEKREKAQRFKKGVIFDKPGLGVGVWIRSAGLSSYGRLDLPTALCTERGRQILAKLIEDLYGDQPFFQKRLNHDLDYADQLVLHLKKSWDELISALEENDFAFKELIDIDWLIPFLHREMREIFCHMLKGGPDHRSLKLFVSADRQRRFEQKGRKCTLAAVYLQHALPALRRALLGPQLFDLFEHAYQSALHQARQSTQSKSRDELLKDLELLPHLALSKRACSSLLRDLMKKRGLRKQDIPGYSALRFDARCPASFDVVILQKALSAQHDSNALNSDL